jgi:flavorubredoxin
MLTTKLSDQIIYLGANDNEIKKFEALWDIPQGVSYNSYLILDKKTALIDTVEQKFNQEFIQLVQKTLDGRSLDYLILNHMEPDHSGTLNQIKELYPELKIIGNHKTTGFIQGFYHLPTDQVQEVSSGDKFSLGKHQLIFLQVSMVHWPESMVTFEETNGILFSSDVFGGFKTVDDQPLADQHQDLTDYINQARQYFATVLGAHTRPTARALKQLSDLPIKTIAPAHGLVWQKNHQEIFQLYEKWSNFQADAGVTIIYGSMYGFTEQIAQLVADTLQQKNIKVSLFNAAETSLSEQLNKIWQYQGLIIASCTYNNKLFPPIKNLINGLEDRRLQNRLLGIIGSYSWTGGAMRFLSEFAQNSKLELIEPQFETQYSLNEKSEKQAIELAENFMKALKTAT